MNRDGEGLTLRHRATEEESAEVSALVIGAAIEVHRALGPGLLEAAYEEALCHELGLRGVGFERQVLLPWANGQPSSGALR